MKWTLVVTLVSALGAACSGPREPPPSADAGREGAASASAAAASNAAPQETPVGAAPANGAPVPAPQGQARAPEPRPEPPATPAPEPTPTFREITIPAGTTLSVTLETPVASDTSKVEDPVSGTLARPIVISGAVAVPANARISGSIVEADKSGRVKGRASVAFQFDRLDVRGDSHSIRTGRIAREAAASTKKDVKKGGIGAAAGAIVGGIAGGGKGAAIGAGVGGAGAVLVTKGDEVRLPAGTTVTTTLREPLTVQVPVK